MKDSLVFKKGRLFIIDQRKLPLKLDYIEIKNIKEGVEALRKLKVRGAPLIGVFAGYALWVSIKNFSISNKQRFLKTLNKNISHLKKSRPTAVNLFWALEKIKRRIEKNREKDVPFLKKLILEETIRIHKEDRQVCQMIGRKGLRLIKSKDAILTHCNTGFLATSGQGTALSVIYEAKKRYPEIKVYVDETRPLLQGSRLTAWELLSEGVDVTVICDSMAGFLMQKGMITKIIVGADRITSEGGVANKVGTYTLAVLAKFHKIPFYVAAPSSSFDLSLKKPEEIPIEERSEEEVKKIGNKFIAPAKVKVLNPAFDLTPPSLITAFITEKGIILPPFRKKIKKYIGNK